MTRTPANVPTVIEFDIDTSPHEHPTAVAGPVDVRTDDGLMVAVPILGPSSVLMLRLIAEQPGRQWHLADLAGQIGVSVSVARRCLERMVMFGWATSIDDRWTIHTNVAPSARNVERLHPETAARYARTRGQVGERS